VLKELTTKYSKNQKLICAHLSFTLDLVFGLRILEAIFNFIFFFITFQPDYFFKQKKKRQMVVHWRELIIGFTIATTLGFLFNILSTTKNAVIQEDCSRVLVVQPNMTNEIIVIKEVNITKIEYKEVCSSHAEDYFLGFVKTNTQESKFKENILKYYHDTPMNMEPLEPKITGPREEPLPLKSFVAIAVGIDSEPFVDQLIQLFGMKNFTFMLFSYHPLSLTKFTTYSWFDEVFFVSYPGQMKWWYMKRFLTPIAMKHYEYIFIFDDDVILKPETFRPLEYIQLLRKFNIHLSQPAHAKGSPGALHMSTHQRDNFTHGHWNDLIECGPGTVLSSIIWQTCVWDLLQEDLTSGYGIDLIWHNYCKKIYGFDRTAIIDKFTMFHGDKRSSYEHGKKYDPHAEWTAYRQRFSHIVSESEHKFGNIGGPAF